MSTERWKVADEVARALAAHRPVVALETTVVTHGLPAPEGVKVARAMEDAVTGAGAMGSCAWGCRPTTSIGSRPRPTCPS
jgi:pseudouridine-5'-phosphate glycosidase